MGSQSSAAYFLIMTNLVGKVRAWLGEAQSEAKQELSGAPMMEEQHDVVSSLTLVEWWLHVRWTDLWTSVFVWPATDIG